ncbi:MAG: hypothetical protein J6R47_02025 [Acholeplasmatales bacterium]|nr:hypothetical protein [Acholeplasmatales bacterium]
MKEIIKKYYKDILLVVGYTVAATVIYGALFNNIWHIWWVNLITVLVIVIIGVIFGIFYIKHLIKKDTPQEESQN